MVGSTGKRYGEEFKLMILEMHKKGKTIRELSSEYKISPHTISYWKNQKKREMKVKYKNDTVKYDEIQSLKIELSEKEKQIKDQAEEIKPRTDVEEQTGRNVDGNIVVDNPEALKKWNELSKDTRDLLKLMNMNETNWNNMLPKQRESELNCLS